MSNRNILATIHWISIQLAKKVLLAKDSRSSPEMNKLMEFPI